MSAAFLTDFADQAVVLPLAAAIAIGLAACGWRRGALAWIAAVAGTLGIMGVLKLASHACGPLLPGLHLRSPSGHTAAAAAVYGGLIALLGRRFLDRPAWLGAGAVLCAAAIGASRLALGVHSVIEVAIGGIVGVAGAFVLIRLAGRPPPALRPAPLVAAVLAVAVAFHGFHLPAEAAIRDSALVHIWPLSACRAD